MEEKVATLESLEDETQSGNMRESFSLEKVTLMSGILRRSSEEKVATLESLEDETQSGNGQDNFERCSICWESSLSKACPKLRSFLAEKVYKTLFGDIRDIWERCLESSPFKEEMGSESLKKGTKRRDDIGSREEYTTEFSHQEKTTTAKVRFPLHLIA